MRMDPFKDIVTKNVVSSFSFIENTESPAKYRIDSKESLLNGGTAEIYRAEDSLILAFNTVRPLSQDERNLMWESETEFICENESRNLIFDFSSFSQWSLSIMKDPAKFKCRVSKYRNTEVSKKGNQFYRVIIPTKDAQQPGGLFESSKVKIDHTTYMAGLVPILMNGLSFHLFAQTSDDKKRHFLFIECLEQTDYQTFKKNVDIILLSYAFVSGYFPRDRRYVVSSQDSSFSNIQGVSYETLPKSFSSPYSVVPSGALAIHFGLPQNISFPQQSFNHLCQVLVSHRDLAHVILILVEGHTQSNELRAAVYSIALEAISDIVCRENESKIVPIPNKSLAKKVLKALGRTLDSFNNEMSPAGLDTLRRKISVLNSPTNKEKLLKPFSLLQITLNTGEIDCIDKRNDFLHGRFPFSLTDLNDKFQLEQITLTLLYCVTALILKYIDYSGFVTYYPAFNQYKRRRLITDPFIKRI